MQEYIRKMSAEIINANDNKSVLTKIKNKLYLTLSNFQLNTGLQFIHQHIQKCKLSGFARGNKSQALRIERAIANNIPIEKRMRFHGNEGKKFWEEIMSKTEKKETITKADTMREQKGIMKTNDTKNP